MLSGAEKTPLARISLYGRSELHSVHTIGKIQTRANTQMKIEMKRSFTRWRPR